MNLRISKHLALALVLSGFTSVWGQPIVVGHNGAEPVVAQATNFTRFSLDFPGGTPRQLVSALEKAVDKALNVIVLESDANVQLPAFKLRNVCLPEVFVALTAVSRKTEYIPMLNSQGFISSQPFETSYEFHTQDTNPGPDSVWYFHANKPSVLSKPEEKACRFYLLAPYLERGLTVDDITTAVQTAWRLEGDNGLSKINFHKETSLLIAVGTPDRLEVIDKALKVLDGLKAKSATGPHTGASSSKAESDSGR